MLGKLSSAANPISPFSISSHPGLLSLFFPYPDKPSSLKPSEGSG